MPVFNNVLAGSSGQAAGYEIDQSVRFDDGDSAYLSRTAGTATSNDTGTLSFWTKRGNLGGGNAFFSNHSDANNRTYVGFDADKIQMYGKISGSTNVELVTAPVFRDPSAWYHIVIAVDVNQSTASDRVKIYVNGSQVTDFSTSTYPAQNTDLPLFSKTNHQVGAFYSSSVGDYYDGCLAEFHYIDGQQLTPASFGETDSTTNQWRPIEIKSGDLTYGANGFYQKYSSTELANSFSNDTYSGDTFVPSSNLTVNYLVVAGGGSGGAGDKHNYGGGGGGAGGLLSGSTSVTSGTSYPITVGAGGAAIAPSNDSGAAGNNGSNSVFSSFTAIGGGGGSHASTAAKDGGSGGGGAGGSASGADGTSGQGNDGGDADNYLGAGGGGAGGAGATRSGTTGGAGGAGADHSGTFGTGYGASGLFAGGGGGGYVTYGGQGDTAGPGGSGGGGASGATDGTSGATTQGVAGTANTGSGGGGGSSYHSGSTSTSSGGSGAGGSGVVLIRYAGSSPQATGGTISTVNISGTDYQVHAFTNVYTDHTITANGHVTNEVVSKFGVTNNSDTTGGSHVIGPKIGTGCAMFDGSDTLSIADSTDFDFGTGDFTIEGWINGDYFHDSTDATFITIGSLQIYYDGATQANQMSVYDMTAASHLLNSSGSFWLPQTWYHLAVVRNSGVTKMYQNGVEVGSVSDTAAHNSSATSYIGNYSSGSYYWKGYMDEIRVSNTARYTSAFTPSTTAFSNDSNTKLLLHCDGAMGSTTFTDSSGSSHTVTVNGDTKVVAPKFGSGCYRNNGSDNGIQVSSGNVGFTEFGTGDFTVEAWVCIDDITTDNQQFLTHRNTVNNGDWVFWWDASDGLTWSGDSNTLAQGNTTGWASKTWVHVAASRASGVNKLFVNGTLVATNSSATQDYDATADLFVGAYGTGSSMSSSGALTGFMDQVRITPGKALYTSGFSVPSALFDDNIDTAMLMQFNQIDGKPYQDAYNAVFYTSGSPSVDSIIKFDGTGDYLTAPDSSDWDVFGSSSDNWTIDFFVKHTDHAGSETYLSQSEDSSNYWQLAHYHSGGLWFGVKSGGSWIIDSTDGGYGAEIKDKGWHHVALCKVGQEYGIYLDGVQGEYISDSSTDTFSALLAIGTSTWDGTNRDFDGYMDGIRIQSSNVFSASPNVGKTDTITVPTSSPTADSNTKLLINSGSWDRGLGADSSGNLNNFTPNNVVATDQVLDSPTNNFCTINGLTESVTNRNDFSEGNLRATANDISGNSSAWFTATMGIPPNTGKWYWEFADEIYIDADTFGGTYPDGWGMGLLADDGHAALAGDTDISNNGWWFSKSNNNVGTSRARGGSTSSENKRVPSTATGVFKCCYDSDNGAFWFGGDLGWTSSSTTSTPETSDQPGSGNDLWDSGTGVGFSGYTVIPAWATINAGGNLTQLRFNFGQDSTFAGIRSGVSGTAGNPSGGGYGGNTDANGYGDFFYEVPTGFKALCSGNLPDPEIADPTKHFDTALYTGNGSTQTISSLNFQPDLVWTKPRSISSSHGLTDSVRGAGRSMKTNDTASERPVSGSPGASDDVYAFTSSGFSVGTDNYLNVNQNTVTYASWNWKAAASNTSVSAGSIDGTNPTLACTRRTNTTAGFSIVSWEGTGSDGTVAHGLSQAPELIINKSRGDAYNWAVQNILWNSASDTNMLYLNTNAGQADDTNVFQAAPTSTVFSPQGGAWAGIGTDDITYIAYCFHSVEGYSKIGKYNGNGNSDGKFIYTGFRPAFLMVKLATAANGEWVMFDNKRDPDNPTGRVFYANINAADTDVSSYHPYDLLSNGFKGRIPAGDGNEASYNTVGETYIYLAFAESPFKYSNAR